MSKCLLLIFPLVLLTVSCETRDSRRDSTREAQETTVAKQTAAASEIAIPSDIKYSVVEAESLQSAKRSLSVRLNKEVSEEILKLIALQLKKTQSKPYERTFITYYLPGMVLGSGAWATTHFNPDLKVHIVPKPTKAQAPSKPKTPPKSQSTKIGSWVDDALGSRITIQKGPNGFSLECKYSDGSVQRIRLTERQSSLGRRFDPAEGSSTGDHWVIVANGQLQIRDRQGLIATARAQ